MSSFDKNDKSPLPIGENKKVPGLFKDELGEKIITEFVTHKHTHIYMVMVIIIKKLNVQKSV